MPFLCAVSLGLRTSTDYLQLCDHSQSSSYGAARCYWLSGGCQGATFGTGDAGKCFPYIIWSDKQVDGTHHWSPELVSGRFFEYFGDAGHVSTYASSVRCVLGLRQSSAAHTPVCSCATGMRVQSTALHSATSSMAAARALRIPIATRMTYGPVPLWTQKVITEAFTLLRVRYLACLVTKAGVSVLTPSPFLCAVSWI